MIPLKNISWVGKKKIFLLAIPIVLILAWADGSEAQLISESRVDSIEVSVIGNGWARNSINTVIFRQNSITTFEGVQYASYYDAEGTVILAKRKLGANRWKRKQTRFKAKVKDAHNSISIAVDGSGFLHMAWGLHGQPLKYARGSAPGSLLLQEINTMTGSNEQAVTYPQFYRLKNGDLLFMYRQGQSGSGNIMLNRYQIKSKQWFKIAHPLIDGEGERNAYMNSLAFDEKGGWHVSWTWRETWDVATNHDIMYAYSSDEGASWHQSEGKIYRLPITQQNAEIAYKIDQGSELINQTSMTIDSNGNPVIASYWKAADDISPQYHIVYQQDSSWVARKVSNRKEPFSLSGGGTKRLPISRPQIVAGTQHDLYLIYRDSNRDGGISIAASTDSSYTQWVHEDIYSQHVGQWEPTFDRQAWNKYRQLFLFVQRVGQGDSESLEELDPTSVKVLSWIPPLYR